MTVRLPDATFLQINALSRALGAPGWKVIAQAVGAYIGASEGLSAAQQAIAKAVLKLPSE
jgi:hypothetical protein